MTNITVKVIVEGTTEEYFITKVLAPELWSKNIWIEATKVSKPGQKGGDVRFERVKNDISNYLKQRSDTIVTTFIDYYGLKEWPSLDKIPEKSKPDQISNILNTAAMKIMKSELKRIDVEHRYIPFVMVHEFETLLFSEPDILASNINVKKSEVIDAVKKAGEPEMVNNSKETAPSKRIEKWKPDYKKTVDGIKIAKDIGIQKMRSKCPTFDTWLKQIESLVE